MSTATPSANAPTTCECPECAGVVAINRTVIRGETYHFEIVAGESARGIMALTMDGNAIGNGILTTENEAQAIARADPAQLDKGGGAAQAAQREARARELLAQVGLAGREAAYPRQLSLGQQRRLSLARAFAARPGILLMDEPFASLDEATRDRMLDLTVQLLDSSGAGLILVTHDPAEAARLSARPLTLSGSPATLG